MRVPDEVHQAKSWVIARIAPDFELLDVWALPVEGAVDDFAAALDLMASFDPARAGSLPSRALFWVRLRLGDLFGWDDVGTHRPIPGCTETTLRDRLPDELRVLGAYPPVGETLDCVAGGFTPIYRTDDEWAAELSNATVHGVLHLSWVEQPSGRFRAHMAVYVKPRGVLGRAYLRFIDPFRHLIVYPARMRQIGDAWEARRSTR
jgi:hypothetical protein